MRIKRFMLLMCLCALLSALTGAKAVEIIDRRDSQHEYGAYVASLTAQRSASSRRLTPRSAPRVLVLLKTDGGSVDLEALGPAGCVAGPENRFTLVFASAEAAEAAIAALQSDPHVLYAEQDGEVYACETAALDDVAFNSYGATSMGFQSLLSWAHRCDGSTTVAIIDSGVYAHDLLADRLQSGWDYVDGDDDPTNDDFGHGTHVAGIVADCTRDASVSLYALRVLNAEGRGTASNAANAILEAVDRRIPIINLSFAGTTASAALDDAVLNALESGCTVVVAAGNNAMDTSGVWPAHLTEAGVIVVGAADARGQRASYSNFGDSVDFYAYGSSVKSCSNTGGYINKSGTSQATPHIAAACALLNIIRGGVSPAEAEATLKRVLAGPSGEIPMLDQLVPQRISCRVAALKMGVGETLALPVQALPQTSGARVVWSSSDASVAYVDDSGALTAAGPGTAMLTGQCDNFDDLTATIIVTETPAGALRLPTSLAALESGAFAETPVPYLIVGEGLSQIAEDAVDPRTVVLCAPDSFAADFAEANGLQYIATEQ